MKKLPILLVLITVLLVIGSTAVSAQRPIPNTYSINLEYGCWLPDGEAAPTPVLRPASSYSWTKPATLIVRCSGWLPDWAPHPKVPLKLTYDDTGIACEATLKTSTYLTANYGAVVYPLGLSVIECRFNLDPIDP
jgi:hypothetical protein